MTTKAAFTVETRGPPFVADVEAGGSVASVRLTTAMREAAVRIRVDMASCGGRVVNE